MAISAKSRNSINPFNENLRDRFFSSATSSDLDDAVSSSPQRLSFLVQNFLENSDLDPSPSFDADDPESDDDPALLTRESAYPDRFRSDLFAHATAAAETFSPLRRSHAAFTRNVVAYLREIGYSDVGICATNWQAENGTGLIAGSHEFIDVVVERNSRYVVDLNFAAQFEIARETERYRRVVGSLPIVFVGKPEDLKRIVRVTAEEMKRSMKASEMSLPPWRKSRYLMAKWFGPCRRSVAADSEAAVMSVSAVKCRSVGFFANGVVAPPSTRTR